MRMPQIAHWILTAPKTSFHRGSIACVFRKAQEFRICNVGLSVTNKLQD